MTVNTQPGFNFAPAINEQSEVLKTSTDLRWRFRSSVSDIRIHKPKRSWTFINNIEPLSRKFYLHKNSIITRSRAIEACMRRISMLPIFILVTWRTVLFLLYPLAQIDHQKWHEKLPEESPWAIVRSPASSLAQFVRPFAASALWLFRARNKLVRQLSPADYEEKANLNEVNECLLDYGKSTTTSMKRLY